MFIEENFKVILARDKRDESHFSSLIPEMLSFYLSEYAQVWHWISAPLWETVCKHSNKSRAVIFHICFVFISMTWKDQVSKCRNPCSCSATRVLACTLDFIKQLVSLGRESAGFELKTLFSGSCFTSNKTKFI